MVYLTAPAPFEDADAQQMRIRMEQKLNSLSPESLEKIFSRPELQSGLIRFELIRPEHKLRDLARNLLGITEEALGELDIVQVAKLFYDRRMTFTLDQVANVAVRRLRKHVTARLLSTFYYQRPTKDQSDLLFLVHDDQGVVRLLVMKDEINFFPCTITPLSDGPLFDGLIRAVILRHPNPYLYWHVRADEEVKEAGSTVSSRRIGQEVKINCSVDAFHRHPELEGADKKFVEKLQHAYGLQNLDVKVGYGIHTPHYQEGNDVRSLFGFPEEGPALDPDALAVDAWMHEMRCWMAMMYDGGSLPPALSIAAMRQRDIKLEWMRESGLTFSIRDAALFMHNAPRLANTSDTYVLFVHDEDGRVYVVPIAYKDQRIWHVEISRANLHKSLVDWSSHVKVCLRIHFTEGTLLVTQPSLLNDSNRKRGYEAILPSPH